MKLGFIGVGKITAALVEGYCTAGIDKLEVYLSPRNADKADALSNQYESVHKMESNQQVLERADIIFLALRPDDAREVIANLEFDSRHVVISMIAFLKHPELSDLAVPAAHTCRALPLPSVVNHNCPIPVFNQHDVVKSVFEYVGQPIAMTTEDELHRIWTLTGFISPFYDMMSTLSQWAIDKGVAPASANQYVADMFQSLAHTAQNSEHLDLQGLARQAATAKGLNEQALNAIKAKGAHEVYHDTAEAIFERIEKSLLEANQKH